MSSIFNKLGTDTFKIDTIVPAIQTGAVALTNEVLGQLGCYSCSTRLAVAVGGVASIVSAIVRNVFKNQYVSYATTFVASTLSSFGVHYLLRSTLPLSSIYAGLAVGGIITSVRMISDFLKYVQKTRDVEVSVTATATTV